MMTPIQEQALLCTKRWRILLVLSVLIAGCGHTPIQQDFATQAAPESWQAEAAQESVATPWLSQMQDDQLSAWVALAFQGNFGLAQQAASLASARQQLHIAGAPLWPQLQLGTQQSRTRQVTNNVGHSSHTNAELGLSWELDLWGKLSDSKRQSLHALQAQQAKYDQARLQLAADVAGAWYNLLAAQELVTLFEERLANLSKNLEIIEFGYRQGITQALDVYFARNEVEQEQARLAQQRQSKLEAGHRLQFLVGRMPTGDMAVASRLPELEAPIAAGLPSELLTRRPGIRAAWFDLLASDAALAVAHKARFPSLRLTGSVGDSGAAANQLFDGGPLAWTLLGGVTQPLFQGGRLAAQEAQALAQRQQQEQRYLETIYLAMQETENLLFKQRSLNERYQRFLVAQENALAAQALAFDQYQRGLIVYTSVLEAQRRAFDAQTQVLELRNQRIQNRIALHLALGGSAFEDTE